MARPNGRWQVGRVDLSRVFFATVVCCTTLAVTFAVGVRAGSRKTAAYFFLVDLRDSLRVAAAEAPTLTGQRPTHFLEPSRYDGQGVTINDPATDQSDVILIASFFDETNELRLIRRNGDVLARWPVAYHQLFPDHDFIPSNETPATDWNVDTHGALVEPDGSVVFNFEYSGLVKLDRCNHVVWTVKQRTHHSVERAEGGGFLVPARRLILTGTTPIPPFETPYHEDTVLRVSEDGKVLSETSVVRLLYDNPDLRALLTATGTFFTQDMTWDREVVHLNKVGELTSEMAADFPMFEGGDLVVSIRELNLVLVTDRTMSRVKWWKVGPWLRQHDPEFAPGGKIVLFNNNTFATVYGHDPQHRIPATTPLTSEIVAVDPASRATEVLFGDKPGQEMLSVFRGKVAVTPGGGLFVTEADGGRIREIDAHGRIVWEYMNRYDAEAVAEISEARLYPAGYFNFDVGAWPCEGR